MSETQLVNVICETYNELAIEVRMDAAVETELCYPH